MLNYWGRVVAKADRISDEVMGKKRTHIKHQASRGNGQNVFNAISTKLFVRIEPPVVAPNGHKRWGSSGQVEAWVRDRRGESLQKL